jgi:cob(I)alamin adenosyltransferase
MSEISMTSAISSSTASSLLGSTSTSSSSSSSTTSTAEIEAQIASLQTQLSSETDETKKTTIQQQIAALEAQLEAAEAAEKAKSGGDSSSTEQQAPATFSGESDKIGTGNFDESTPFGERTAWV